MAVKRGLSLIELSITIILIGLIASGMLGMFSQGFSYLKRSKERTVAYNLAREVMEEYFTLDSVEIPLAPQTLNGITYNRNLTISEDDPKTITVIISWGTQNYTLATLKANY